MHGTKTKPATKPNRTRASTRNAKTPAMAEVLTLAEAAAYLRVSEEELLRLVAPGGLPGRKIGAEWRFSKAALQAWLAAPLAPSSQDSLLSLAGAWKDDPHLAEMLDQIYKQRGRPMTEEAE